MTLATPATTTTVTATDGERHSVVRNAGILMGGQAIGLVVPLLTIPYLARVLGPDAWGPVLASQALGNWLMLVLEFGFELSGTRAVARARTAPETMVEVVHGIQSAKLMLALLVTPVALIIIFAVPSLGQNLALIGWAVAFAILRGLSPLWFFQGMERVKGAVAVDATTRAAAALGVFIWVRQPHDGWRVLALQAVFAALSLIVLTLWLGRHVPHRVPRVAAGVRTIREAWSIFACRAWSGLYIQANTLILSALASAATVAFFGGAERIVRAAINLLQPITQAFLPRVSYLHAADPEKAKGAIRRSFVVLGLIGAAMGATALFGAPLLVRFLLGPQYGAAVPVLRALAVLPPLVAVNSVLGIYWALPFGRERAFLATIIAAGIANVLLAIVLVPLFGAVGMAMSAVAAEVVVLGVLGTLYLRSR